MGQAQRAEFNEDIQYRIKFSGKTLQRYYDDRSRVSLIMGPLGSGKTITTCLKLLTLMSEQKANAQGIRPSRWIAIRNTYSDLLTTTVKDWLSITGELGTYNEGNKKPPTHTLQFQIEDGTLVHAEMIFLALDREHHVKKLRGIQCTGVWLSEAKELSKSIVDLADLRHGRYPSFASGNVKCSWHGMVGDTNAPDTDHWYYTLAEVAKPKEWKFFRQPGGVIKQNEKWILNSLAENTENLPTNYYESGMQGKDDRWIACNLGNEYAATFDGKPVYTQFSEALHVAKLEPIPTLPLLFAWDFGLTPACLIAQMTANGQLRVLHEFWSERAGIKQFGLEVIRPFLNRYYKGYKLGMSIGDPAGRQGAQTDEKTCIQTLSDSYNKADPNKGGLGIDTFAASTNSFEKRTEAVKGFCNQLIDGKPALVVDRSCKLIIDGFAGGYHFEREQSYLKQGMFKDVPKKNKYSHPHDALQYLCLGASEGLAYEEDDPYEDEERHEQGRSPYTGY